MDKVALLPTGDRAALFGETGASRGVGNLIIEKDFWVCWTLKRLFEPHKTDVPTLVFKGGTPLSKAYGAIRRFSEDIDLSFDRADLGYTGERDPEKGGISKKRARQLAAHAQDFAIAYLPAYAPELNPEEQCNAFVKRAMENALPGSVDDLHRLVRLEFARLQRRPKMIVSFFDTQASPSQDIREDHKFAMVRHSNFAPTHKNRAEQVF